MNKKAMLNDLVKLYGNLPKQGTTEWLKLRETCIGGSEIGIVTGKHKYKKIKDLINIKLGKTKFNGNLATRWGSLFEKVTVNICHNLFNIKLIEELSSLPTKNKYLRFSPDGLTILQMKNEKNENEDKLILFEFKSPLFLIPNGSIPEYYIPQIKMGLWAIDMVDFGIFISNMYRICSFYDFTDNLNYNNYFHNKDLYKIKQGELKLLSMGFIGFYSDEILLNNNSIIDVGALNYKSFNKILKLYEKKKINIWLSNPYIYEDFYKINSFDKSIFNRNNVNNIPINEYKKKEKSSFIDFLKKNNKNAVGMLCWKLLKSDIINVKRDNKIITDLLDDVNHIMSNINIIKKTNDDLLYKELIEKYK